VPAAVVVGAMMLLLEETLLENEARAVGRAPPVSSIADIVELFLEIDATNNSINA
jgi:hypothetical protein